VHPVMAEQIPAAIGLAAAFVAAITSAFDGAARVQKYTVTGLLTDPHAAAGGFAGCGAL